jgi:rhamnosyltransferase
LSNGATTPVPDKKVLVIAHYDVEGGLRSDTLNAILAARKFFDEVILVSTNLSDSSIRRLPAFVQWRRRANIGYDFYSYREGIVLASHKFCMDAEVSNLTIMNSSFVILDPNVFFKTMQQHWEAGSFDCFGVTKSFQINEHLQSYFVTFSHNILSQKKFMDWWLNMEPISDKARVIQEYEIGLSSFVAQMGYKLSAAIVGDLDDNPSHSRFLELLENYSIIKVELFCHNPLRINLTDVWSLFKHNRLFRTAVYESLKHHGLLHRIRLALKAHLGLRKNTRGFVRRPRTKKRGWEKWRDKWTGQTKARAT